MNKTLIQIYEVQKPREAQALVETGVDHVGSVLVDPEKGKIPSVRKTIQVVKSSGAKSILIPLMKDPVRIFQALDYYQPDIVHLCEVLSPYPKEKQTVVRDFDVLTSLQIDIKDRFPQIDIMRSLSIPRPGDGDAAVIEKNVLEFVQRFAPFSDYFLIDTLLSGENQPVAGYVGITGQTCDWRIAKAVIEQSPIPVILAGGLAGDNVYEAVVNLAPAGVDSCTRTNAADRNGQTVRFKKDMKKVRRFVEEVRRADRVAEGERLAAESVS